MIRVIRLSTPDLRALRCRLGAEVLLVGLAPGPAHDSAEEIEMYDPDLSLTRPRNWLTVESTMWKNASCWPHAGWGRSATGPGARVEDRWVVAAPGRRLGALEPEPGSDPAPR